MQRPNFATPNLSTEALNAKPKMTLKMAEFAQAHF